VIGRVISVVDPKTSPTVDQPNCPFCRPETNRIRLEYELAVAVLDGFPITSGHTLVVPKRHVVSLFELPDAEQVAVWALVAGVRADLLAEFRPDGFTVGLNDGPAAGQTVPHAHVHVIPRRHGDVPDPRGGVRWVIPDRAAYWAGGRP
jgi:diadenosine tetraphosphate (Ap4A) HIT family hydrolase